MPSSNDHRNGNSWPLAFLTVEEHPVLNLSVHLEWHFNIADRDVIELSAAYAKNLASCPHLKALESIQRARLSTLDKSGAGTWWPSPV